MNNNNNSREDQWLQHQVQDITPCFNAINMTSPSASSLGDGGGSAGRRSRSSKRAIPTTLLNANPSNFRALVQKFTGRSSGGESNRRKGPVTLDFGSPTSVSKEAIFPVSGGRSNPHVSNEQCHVTWSSCTTATYQLSEETNSVFGRDHEHDLLMEYSGNSDLLREYSGNSSYDDGLDHMDCYYHDFHQETATLEEFMMRDLDL